ncbi:conserved hypothetical protein [Leishmania mexicana MHOM/GT/2001/U1103]|uniref:PITH domain-containing protein n=1 Tax=Leishmania mexicana (strain MHOM/GT/2001/U1103) TaxID=929439 RepID=E9AMW5_LEIMU|nr:conserved hypothetical protein [Leishmania mexicana MHOM/GT/2001/U1103]CBZ24270.1 conserved hypothetical protein [Leishmania mexicana MHOM/GT/2001/U1103]
MPPPPPPVLSHPKRREPHTVTTQRTQTRRELTEVQGTQNERKAKMAATNPRVLFDVHFTSFHDDNLPGTAITDPKNPTSFVLTTGGFPQEVIVQTRAASAKISKLSVTLNDAKDILLDKCCGEAPTAFDVMAERTLARGSVGGPQTETFDLDPEGAGRDIRFIRLTILSGYSEFVAVYSIDAWGEESQQRIAVLQSKPEVVM